MILLSRLLLIAGHDRFWILSAHPEMNLLAAGHDSGMIVFKLERERPAFSVSGDSMYYVKDRGSSNLNQGAKTLSYSPTENAALICSDMEGGSYELYVIPKDSFGRGDTVQEAKRGIGGPAVEKTARQILQAAEKNMTDATQLNYDFRNPFVVCGATYVPIYRGQKDVSCPYCSSRFVPDQEGKLCSFVIFQWLDQMHLVEECKYASAPAVSAAIFSRNSHESDGSLIFML
ncbi:hypothetical protein TB1_004592 [Malus domestica]